MLPAEQRDADREKSADSDTVQVSVLFSPISLTSIPT